jgi:hypothetical protein
MSKVREPVFVFVKIPEQLMPLDRDEKYGDPLDMALQTAGVGEVTGGGSQLGELNQSGDRSIERIALDVDLADAASGLPVLRRVLKQLGAPPTTVMNYTCNGQRVEDLLG